MRRQKPQTPRPPPRGSDYAMTGTELTILGHEQSDELSHQQIVTERAQTQTFWVQGKAVVGLTILLGQVLLLGALAMIGVAASWFSSEFALELLAITLTPSFSAWIIIIRWAFRERKGDG